MHDDDAPIARVAPVGAVAPGTTPRAARTGPDLPPVPEWLDEIEGPQALEWVTRRNQETEAAYAADAGFIELAGDIETILDAPDRIPAVTERAGLLYNVWTDADHPRGLWRRTTWLDYAATAPSSSGALPPAEPDWEILLDLDELGRQEGRAWVWHGAQVLATGPDRGRRALITLSEGGSDADVTREFDLSERRFIPAEEGGFYREASKGSMVWADEEGQSVLITTDLGQGSTTRSGYPRQALRLHRGQSLAEAEVLGTASEEAVAVSAAYDIHGRTWLSTLIDFHTRRTWLLPSGIRFPERTCAGPLPEGESIAPGAQRIDVPLSAHISASRDWLIIELREAWEPEDQQDQKGRAFPAGSLLAAPLAEFLEGRRRLTALFTPTGSTSLESVVWTRNHLVITVLDDVVTRLEVLTPPARRGHEEWTRHDLDLSAAGDVPVSPTIDHTDLRAGRPLVTVSARQVDARGGDDLWLSVSGWTTPSTLRVARLTAEGSLQGMSVLRQTPARFDASGVTVSQHVAISADGTRVPYFQVGRAGSDGASGPAPTILYGYGGFEHSLLPRYQPVMGRAWLERGGVYAVANIRGGGEYGPAWHRAALTNNRLRACEDFAAVAAGLVERGVTAPQRLAVHGGSNGGLLTGMMLTRHPELVGAVVCEVPLLDMRRYTHLLAGHSWMAEYGDPDDEAQWEFIKEFSPFHLLRPGLPYPPVLLVTSTRDDRVHPAHARTMAHRLRALGQSVTYFENSEGGHGRASTNAQRAFMSALVYEFCWRSLAS